MKKVLIIAVFIFTAMSFTDIKNEQIDVISQNIKHNNIEKLNTNHVLESYPNCFAFSLAVYDSALMVGDESFAYAMMISAFNSCG